MLSYSPLIYWLIIPFKNLAFIDLKQDICFIVLADSTDICAKITKPEDPIALVTLGKFVHVNLGIVIIQ